MKRRKNRPFSPSGLALRWLKRKCIWYVPHLCILQWHFCPCHWSFWQGNHLLCGMKVKTDWDESSPYAAMLAAQDVAQRSRSWASLPSTSSTRPQEETGPDSWTGVSTSPQKPACSGMKTGQIEDVTPIPSDSTHQRCCCDCHLWTGLLKLLLFSVKLPWRKLKKKKRLGYRNFINWPLKIWPFATPVRLKL